MNTKLTPLHFSEWGHHASREYVLNGKSLNSSICKIASENELSPIQIQRVCEIANHHAYSQLFKTAEEKTFGFPLAKTEEIMSMIDEEPEKIASDYLLSANGIEKDIDVNCIFGIHSISNCPEIEELQKTAVQVIDKISAAKEELNSRLLAINEDIAETEKEFYKIAKEMVIGGSDFANICLACMDSWAGSADILEKVSTDLVRDGVFGAKAQYIQKTGEAVDSEYISSNLGKMNAGMPTKIINGNHPIIATIDTLASKYKKAGDIELANTILDDRSRLIKKRVEDLNTSKKVDLFVQSEV